MQSTGPNLRFCASEIGVDTLEIMEGDLPGRAKKLILEWAKKYQRELKDMWKTQKFIQLPGLE